jgi:hypothetical protein
MSKREKAEREQAVLSEPEALDRLCAHIAERGSLDSWCKAESLRYLPVHDWIHSDAERLGRYSKALEAKDRRLTDRVLDGIDRLVDFDPRLAFDDKGKPLQPHKLPDSVALATSGIERTLDEDGRELVKLRVVSRERGLELAGRRLGLFKDKLELSGNVGLAERLTAARKRVAESKR